MSEVSTGETQSQSGTTAARQMLAALTRHSQEITRRFSDGCDHISKLNASLENKINGRLSIINETAEQIVRLQLENLSAEKDSVLAELTKLRQEELKVLQSIGNNIRDSLSKKLQELIDALKSEVDEKIAGFQDNLQKTETGVSESVENLRKVLNEKLPAHMTALQSEAAEAKKELESIHNKQTELLNQEASLGLDTLAMHCDELKAQLEKQGSENLAALDAVVEKLLVEQQEKLKQRIEALSAMQEQASQQLQADLDEGEKLVSSFTESAQHITELRLGLHNSMANNLALVYRTEIMSAAQEIEDQLVIIRSHLHTVLRNYHDQYVEQSNNLLAKFEKGARETSTQYAQPEGAAAEEAVPDELRAFIEKLQQEAKESVKEITAGAEKRMEESLGDFKARLNKTAQGINATAENRFNDFRKWISETIEANKAKLDDLSIKASALEQLVDESKELISALDQSNLEF